MEDAEKNEKVISQVGLTTGTSEKKKDTKAERSISSAREKENISTRRTGGSIGSV